MPLQSLTYGTMEHVHNPDIPRLWHWLYPSLRLTKRTVMAITKQRHLVIISNVLLFVILDLFRAVCQECVRIWKRTARALIGLGHSSTILVRIKASTSRQCSTRGQSGLQLLASRRGGPSGCLVHVMDSLAYIKPCLSALCRGLSSQQFTPHRLRYLI